TPTGHLLAVRCTERAPSVYDGVAYVRTTNLQHPPTAALSEIVSSHGQDYLVSDINAGAKVKIQGGSAYVHGFEVQSVRLSPGAVQLFRKQDKTGLLWLGLIYALVVLVAFGSNYAQTYILQWCGQRIIYSIRSTVFQHIEGMHLQFFDRNPIGRLVTRVTNDTEALNEMYTSVLVNIFKDGFLLIGAVVIMFVIDRSLAY
ncbi:ABC transporter ATP-binding protein, partial [mine drainage metagenome]